MSKVRLNLIWAVALALLLPLSTACSIVSVLPEERTPAPASAPMVHTRQLNTPPYIGNQGAIILTISQAGDSHLKEAVDNIIRVAGDSRVPIDVALPPLPDNGNYSDFIYLRNFVDAGSINVCLDGNSLIWLDAETSRNSSAYRNLRDDLRKVREEFHMFFGNAPSACILPEMYFTEINYAVLQDAGFKVLATVNMAEIESYREMVSWDGKPDNEGLYRLPVISVIDYSLPSPKKGKVNTALNTALLSDVDKRALDAVQQSLLKWGVAAVEILPSTFLGTDGRVDPVRITQLESLIKLLKRKGDLTTADDWYSYILRWSATSVAANRVVPSYNGGPAVIFRLDDVALGWHEDVVQEILLIFEKNDIPIDLGVVSNVEGGDSFAIPWLKDYVKKGVAGISVHGYDWEFYEFDTSQSKADYADMKFKLQKARDSYSQYFGVNPVAMTVPTDSWDKVGYLAVQDSGFKVFSTHLTEEPHPSIDPVDVDGRKDPSGMYRIPTSSDVCEWDETRLTWGDVIDISKIAEITDYCKYYQAYEDMYDNEICTTTCSLLGYLGVAAITIHPDAFLTADDAVDKEKLARIQPILDWVKKQATVTTFEAWYNYRTTRK